MDMQTWASVATMIATVIAGMAYMSGKMNRLADRIDTTRSELGQRIDVTRADLGQRIDATRDELRQRIDTTHADLSQRIDTTHTDLSQRITSTRDQSATGQTTLRTDLKADISELRSAVGTLDERVYQLNSSVVALLAHEQARVEPQ